MGDIIKITHENYMLMRILKLHSSKSLETELLIFYTKKELFWLTLYSLEISHFWNGIKTRALIFNSGAEL